MSESAISARRLGSPVSAVEAASLRLLVSILRVATKIRRAGRRRRRGVPGGRASAARGAGIARRLLTTVGFACLAVSIPALKICDRGLVRVARDSQEGVELLAGDVKLKERERRLT